MEEKVKEVFDTLNLVKCKGGTCVSINSRNAYYYAHKSDKTRKLKYERYRYIR